MDDYEYRPDEDRSRDLTDPIKASEGGSANPFGEESIDVSEGGSANPFGEESIDVSEGGSANPFGGESIDVSEGGSANSFGGDSIHVSEGGSANSFGGDSIHVSEGGSANSFGGEAMDAFEGGSMGIPGAESRKPYRDSEGIHSARDAAFRRDSSDQDARYRYIPNEPRYKDQGKKKGGWFKGALKTVSYALIFGLVSGLAIAGIDVAKDRLFPDQTKRIEINSSDSDQKEDSGQAGDSAANTQTAGQDISAVVEKVMPSVVSVTGTYRTKDFFGFSSGESKGAGSGFLIAEDDNRLLIATNNHVVAESTSLTVGFIDESTAQATVVGKDSNSDLAVISVNKKDISQETAKKIKIATLGESENLKVGQTVIVIGNAMGYGQSVTVGVLSAKNREVSFTDGTMTLLQTDAAINPGNSGGVMIDLNGKVVGVSNAKLVDTSVESVCYAIPITTAKTVLTELMNTGEISKEDASYLGIVGSNIDDNYSKALNMPKGIYVREVVKGSPAEKSGISAGDIITALDGTNLSTMNGLKESLSRKKAGTKVTVTIKRANQNGEYETKEIETTLAKASDFEKAGTGQSQPSDNESGKQNDPNGQNGDDGSGGQNGNGDYGNGSGGQNGNGDYGNGSGEDFFGSDSGEEFDPFYYFFR